MCSSDLTPTVVGEIIPLKSGCGKSMTALGIMGLLPEKISRVASGRILFQGEDLASVTQKRLQEIRGNEISMIFQEPMTSLNPVYTIGDQIGEILRRHKGLNRKQSFLQALDLIEAVQIPDPKNKIHSYPLGLVFYFKCMIIQDEIDLGMVRI